MPHFAGIPTQNNAHTVTVVSSFMKELFYFFHCQEGSVHVVKPHNVSEKLK